MHASPQVQNGYTKLANELLVALYRYPFSGGARRVVDWVLRDSYGWGRKKTTPASLAALAEELAMPRASVAFAVQGLIAAAVLLRDEHGCYAFNKHYREWTRQGPAELPLLGTPSAQARAALAANPPGPARVRADRPTPRASGAPPGASQGPFTPPAPAEVAAYCAERGGKVNPERWHAHYAANGWRVGRNPMTDWQASVRSWENNGVGAGPAAVGAGGRACPICARPLTNANAVVCENCVKCRKCGAQTANLVIRTRSDGTKTAWCRPCVHDNKK